MYGAQRTIKIDYDTYKDYNNETDCNSANCYWNTNTSKCVIDICLEDGNFDGFIDGGDLSIFKKEYGRPSCP